MMMNNTENIGYFAIVGVGRSGTSLLMSMLNAHPEIAIPPETHFVDRYIVSKPGRSSLEIAQDLRGDQRFQRLGLSADDLDSIVRSCGESAKAGDLYRCILAGYARQKGVRLIGDKAPKNVEYLPILKRLYPQGKIIHILRDPRAVFYSRTQAAWSSRRSGLSHLVAYRAQSELGREFGNQLFGSLYLEVFYENLVLHPRQELHRIAAFLNVAFDEEMLNYTDSAAELVFPDEADWKKETLQPLIVANISKWKSHLSQRQVAVIEAACPGPFKDGHYSRDQAGSVWSGEWITWTFWVIAKLYQLWVRFKNLQARKSLPMD